MTMEQDEPVDPVDSGATTQSDVKVTRYAVVAADGNIVSWIANADHACDAEAMTDEACAVCGATTPGSTTLKTDANGIIKIYGLNVNAYYYLEETAELDGYNKLKGPIVMFLTNTMDANGNVNLVAMRDDMQISNKQNWVVETGEGTSKTSSVVGITFDVPNYSGAVLPETGGMGTTLFYVFGSIMALGAIIMLVTKKRMA